MEDVAYNGFGFDAIDLKDVVETPFDKRTMIKSILDSSEFSEVMYDLDDKRAPVFASVSCNGDYGYFIYIPDQPRVMEEEPVKVTPDEIIELRFNNQLKISFISGRKIPKIIMNDERATVKI